MMVWVVSEDSVAAMYLALVTVKDYQLFLALWVFFGLPFHLSGDQEQCIGICITFCSQDVFYAENNYEYISVIQKVFLEYFRANH